jgi:nickel superoxide dismutase
MKTSVIGRLFNVIDVRAHCDIPCGIYDPVTAKIAAQTVLKMVMRIEAMEWTEGTSHTAYSNSLSRYIAVKEEHADLVKHEIDVLWHDYFKPEHLEKYPDLHTTVWETTKLASTNKQNVDMDAAKSLVASVDKIAEAFWATKGVDYDDSVAEVRFGT